MSDGFIDLPAFRFNDSDFDLEASVRVRERDGKLVLVTIKADRGTKVVTMPAEAFDALARAVANRQEDARMLPSLDRFLAQAETAAGRPLIVEPDVRVYREAGRRVGKEWAKANPPGGRPVTPPRWSSGLPPTPFRMGDLKSPPGAWRRYVDGLIARWNRFVEKELGE